MKTEFTHQEAQAVAEDLMHRLIPFCERIATVGSLRRNKPMVHDAELLFIPKMETVADPMDMFAKLTISLADDEIIRWKRDGIIKRRPSKIGVLTWGLKNKLALHVASGMPIDLFSTTQENWWMSLVIRTGGKDTNLALTTGAIKLGRKLHAYGSGFTMECGSDWPCKSEEEVFKIAGVPYQPPHLRQ